MRPNNDTFDYGWFFEGDYVENSPTWQDLFGDDFNDDLLDEDELDEAVAGTVSQEAGTSVRCPCPLIVTEYSR